MSKQSRGEHDVDISGPIESGPINGTAPDDGDRAPGRKEPEGAEKSHGPLDVESAEPEVSAIAEAAVGEPAVDEPAVDEPAPDEPAPDEPAVDEPTLHEQGSAETGESHEDSTKKRRRRTSHRRAGALIGVLAALLGFAIAVQVHSNASQDSLSSAREDDLVGILANQNELAERRRAQISDLQKAEQQLQANGNKDGVAQQQAEQENEALAVLLGTVPASGPGIVLTITDPTGNLKAEDLLDVVEELRGAGAEAIQFGPVRVGTSTSFTDSAEGVRVDGVVVKPPYVVSAIGDPKTMDTALNIPGGVTATARAAGGDATVTQRPQITITVVRTLPAPKYATGQK